MSGDYAQRFAAIARLYGRDVAALFPRMHFCVVGLGGVGSWVVEALARTGVGEITLIDHDEIALSNINRQSHALTETVGRKKHQVLCERVAQIQPGCVCHIIDDFLNVDNLDTHIGRQARFDCVIDAIDSIKFKAALIYYCKRNKHAIVTTGGAGGANDPTTIKVADLSRTYNDALAAKVRSRLREDYGYPQNPKRAFGVDCVFSSQQKFYPKEDGTVSHEKPGIAGVSLDCRFGYGSVSFVTAGFGFIAAARAVQKALKKRLKNHA